MSEAHISVAFATLQARVAWLETFARRWARCPFCGGRRKCEPLCAHRMSRPHDHIVVADARRALYGEEVEQP